MTETIVTATFAEGALGRALVRGNTRRVTAIVTETMAETATATTTVTVTATIIAIATAPRTVIGADHAGDPTLLVVGHVVRAETATADRVRATGATHPTGVPGRETESVVATAPRAPLRATRTGLPTPLVHNRRITEGEATGARAIIAAAEGIVEIIVAILLTLAMVLWTSSTRVATLIMTDSYPSVRAP